MALSTHDYDRTIEKHGNTYIPKSTRMKRRSSKKALRKFSRACQSALIAEQLDTWSDKDALALEIATTARVTRWELQDVIDLWEEHNAISPIVKSLAKDQYESFMFGDDDIV